MRPILGGGGGGGWAHKRKPCTDKRGFNPFPYNDHFWKHNGKRRKCSFSHNIFYPFLWQMTLTLVIKIVFYPIEYICEIWKLYDLPFKSYGQCKSFCGQTNGRMDWQTNGQAKNYMPPIYRCRGIKMSKFLHGSTMALTVPWCLLCKQPSYK